MAGAYKGKILISTPDNHGDIFSRSVVLIVEHNEEGAFGLILNRQNEELSRHLSVVMQAPITVFDGGPVENNKIFFIVRGVPTSENGLSLNAEFYVTEDSEAVLAEYLAQQLSVEDVKVFSGYSGWSRGQLEREVKQKYWTVLDIPELDYTLPEDASLWREIMLKLGGDNLLYANAPGDITLN